MKFGKFVVLLFLLYENSFYIVTGQTINEEKNDCTKFYNFINGDSLDYDIKSCCSLSEINCDYEGHIISFERAKIEIPNLIKFPYLSNIKKIVIDNVGFKEIPVNIFNLTTLNILNFQSNQIDVIPPAIRNIPKLKELYLDNNKIKELPSEINNLQNSLTILNLTNNNIERFPQDIKLTHLEILNLDNNNINELPNEMFNLQNLKELTLHNNNIEIIPPAIQKLTKLENLKLSNNNINKLPNEIFKLPNLETLDLQNNPNLNIKIIKFEDSVIENCFFHNITISCYEPHTCKTIHLRDENLNDKILNDFDIEKKYRKCTKEEIYEILNMEEKTKDPSSILIGGIIIGCIIVICNIILVTLIIFKKRKSKQSDESSINRNDISRTGSINISINDNQTNNNNNNNNVYAVINSNNSYNGNNNNNNDYSQNNLNQNYFNQNIIVNTMRIDNITMDVDNKNDANIYSVPFNEEDEPPPEYSEIYNFI